MNGHEVLPSSSLIPDKDPSLLFTNAGMVQFKHFFTGMEEPRMSRVVTAQKCVRAGGKHNDLDNVGYTTRHHTFFEMLGNFSFGDYFKEEAIEFAWKLLVEEFGLLPHRLYITVYHEDEEAHAIWKKLTGFDDHKIIKIATKDNFWSMGDTGPCGPCSEIFYDHGDQYKGDLPGKEGQDGGRYVEIWNLVFMQYELLADGTYIKLPKLSVDTGMGLERIAAVLQGVYDNFSIDIFQNIIQAERKLLRAAVSAMDEVAYKVIADHLRSIAFLIADGVMPSNEGRGYVLRRITRRAMRYAYGLGCREPLIYKLVPALVHEMGKAYPELYRTEQFITSILHAEEEKFLTTLGRGVQLLEESAISLAAGQELDGGTAFKLYDTYGFPLDLTKDMLRMKGCSVNEQQFNEAMRAQKDRARAGWVGSGEVAESPLWFDIYARFGATEFLGYILSAVEAQVLAIIIDGQLVERVDSNIKAVVVLNQTPFYGAGGGQIGDIGQLGGHTVVDTQIYIEKVIGHHVETKAELCVGQVLRAEINIDCRNKIKANHSATHILLNVLRGMLGDHVVQRGSFVSPDKLRFDFSHFSAVSDEQLIRIENAVNAVVLANSPVDVEILPYAEALRRGAIALPGEQYGDEVRVVSLANSMALCGGTHVRSTGEIGMFKILKEEAIASGVRRIEAVTRMEAVAFCQKQNQFLKTIAELLRTADEGMIAKIGTLLEEKKLFERDCIALKMKLALKSDLLVRRLNYCDYGEVILLVRNCSDLDLSAKELKDTARYITTGYGADFAIVTVLFCKEKNADIFSVCVNVTKSLSGLCRAADIILYITSNYGGNGGGNKEMAQAGGVCIGSSFAILSAQLVEYLEVQGASRRK